MLNYDAMHSVCGYDVSEKHEVYETTKHHNPENHNFNFEIILKSATTLSSNPSSPQ
jgi:hypothetical protein